MDERLITQALQEIARKEIPDDMNRLPEIQQQLGRFSRSAARSRTSWVVAAVLAMLAVSIVAYAAARLLQTTPLDPGLQGASEADLLTVLNMDQTIDGVTVTLDYAYADSNRISFALSSEGTTPWELAYRFGEMTLTDDAGHVFQTMFGGGGGGGGGTSDSALTNYSFSAQGSYDPSILTDEPDTIHLRVELPVEQWRLGGVNAEGLPNAESAPAQDVLEKKIGPFIFDFTVPFIHGQIVEPQPSVTASGITVRLDRLVVAPSMTRGVVCIDPASEPGYVPLLSLTVDGEPVDMTQAIATLTASEGESQPGCYDLRINQSFYQRSGEWKLSIDNLANMLPVSYGSGGSGAITDYSIDGVPEVLAKVREKLAPGLEAYHIELTESDNSLKFSFDTSVIDQNAINMLVNEAIREGVEGPWVFTFDVPPAP